MSKSSVRIAFADWWRTSAGESGCAREAGAVIFRTGAPRPTPAAMPVSLQRIDQGQIFGHIRSRGMRAVFARAGRPCQVSCRRPVRFGTAACSPDLKESAETMKRIYTWAASPAERNWTIGDLLAGKGKRKWVQTTANTAEEAAAAEAAGIDLIIGNAWNVEAVRRGSGKLFLTAAIDLVRYPLPDDILRAAMKAMELGADAVLTARSMKIVEMLAGEDIPVMGHLGLVPRKSGWRGGLRAIGKTADGAFQVFEDFRRLENAGAVMVEAEVIPGPVMSEISRRSGLITVSLGSGPGGDVDYLFCNDICGEQENSPRHARAFGNLLELKRQLQDARVAALADFRRACVDGVFPSDAETVDVDPDELDRFVSRLD